MVFKSVAHLTSAHPRYDTRIFVKQCRSLAAHGYDVTLVVADGLGDAVRDGVSIRDVGRSQGRLGRMLHSVRRVYQAALDIDADIYHLHDPELLRVGLRLRRKGKVVIFDSHEDIPKQMLSKPYLGPVRLRLIAFVFSHFERYVCSRISGVVAATPTIRDKFLSINGNTIDINNYPVLGEFDAGIALGARQREVCYIGGISRTRGIVELVDAMARVSSGVRLSLAGNFETAALEADVRQAEGWARVNFHGYLGRSQIRDVLARSMAGMVTLHPISNYLESLPVKMFEYMAAGIPVIASNFPLWEKIISDADCGICVDPLDTSAIADAIDFFVTHPELACQMGRNGRAAVVSHYNWSVEEKKLLSFYSDLIPVAHVGSTLNMTP